MPVKQAVVAAKSADCIGYMPLSNEHLQAFEYDLLFHRDEAWSSCGEAILEATVAAQHRVGINLYGAGSSSGRKHTY